MDAFAQPSVSSNSESPSVSRAWKRSSGRYVFVNPDDGQRVGVGAVGHVLLLPGLDDAGQDNAGRAVGEEDGYFTPARAAGCRRQRWHGAR
jgi:hypothetical protein